MGTRGSTHSKMKMSGLVSQICLVIRTDVFDMILRQTSVTQKASADADLERTTRCQEDVLMVTRRCLQSMSRKPSDGVIMMDLFPLARNIGNWNRHVRSYVDGDILRNGTHG